MRAAALIIIAIHLASVSSKKKRKDTTSESIENILYYKDCNHKQKPPTTAPVLRSPPVQQECKMCCTMCCGDQCVDTHQMKVGRQAQGFDRIEPKAVQPIRPDVILPRERRKKQVPSPLRQPIAGRRGLGFTRENIKILISQDDDIRKILKDLVRVTMQKVDLMQMVNNKQPVKRNPDFSADVSASQNDL